MEEKKFETRGRKVQPELKHRNDIIAARYLDGESVASLAFGYGLSKGTVRNVLTSLCASRREVKAARNEEIRKAYKAGRSSGELAKEYGLPPNWARRICLTTGKVPRFGVVTGAASKQAGDSPKP